MKYALARETFGLECATRRLVAVELQKSQEKQPVAHDVAAVRWRDARPAA